MQPDGSNQTLCTVADGEIPAFAEEQLGDFIFGPALYTRAEALRVLKKYVGSSMRLDAARGIAPLSDRSHVRCAGDELLCTAAIKGQLKKTGSKSGQSGYPVSLQCVVEVEVRCTQFDTL